MKYALYLSVLTACFLMACSDNNTTLREEPTPPEQNDPSTGPTDSPESPDVPGNTSQSITLPADFDPLHGLAPLTTISLNDNENKVNRGLNAFGYDLLGACIAHAQGSNITVSPFSMAVCMAMVANGVDDMEKCGIARALGSSNVDELNSVCNKLLRYVPRRENGCDVVSANAMWHDCSITPAGSYTDLVSSTFGADVRSTDLHADRALADINQWCNENTYGLIPSLFADITAEMQIIWANALYFAGLWEEPFDKELTSTQKFHTPSGDIEVPMMMDKEVGYDIARSPLYTATRKPMKSFSTAITFVLPNEGADIAQVLKSLRNGIDWRPGIVNLGVPRFDAAGDFKFDAVLKDLGICLDGLMMPSMGLTGLSDIKIGQKTAVSLNEDGARGAAATYSYLIGENGPGGTPEKIDLMLNRPFLFFITNTITGTCLMSGYVTQS